MSNLEILEAKPLQLAPKYSRQLEVMQKISQVLGLDEKVEIILQTALHHLLHTLGYRAAQIYRLSPSGRDLWLYLELGPGHKPITQTTDLFSVEEENIIGEAIHRGEPVYIPNIDKAPYASSSPESPKIKSSIRSELAVLLKYGQSCLGVLTVQSNKVNDFGENDIVFLSSLAALLAAAIESHQTKQQLQDDLQEIKILYNLQRHEEISRQLQSTGHKFSIGYEYNRTTISKVDEPSPLAQLALAKEQSGISTAQSNNNQELFAPIQLNGETIGVIGVEDALDEQGWSADEISFLEEVSSQVALAIENAHLLQQTQERTRELSLLFETSRQLSETIDLQQIYDILATQIINYLQADLCSVLLFNAARTHLASIVIKSRIKAQQVVNYSESWVDAVEDVAYLEPLLQSPDPIIQHLDSLDFDLKRPLRNKKLHTLVTFPLIVRHKLMGVLEVGHTHHHDYTKNELQLAQAIVARATIAVENAQLFQQIQAALSETQKLYDISRSLAESTDLDEIFNVVIENVKAYDIDRVSISLVNHDQSGDIEGVTIVASWDKESDSILPIGTKISIDTFSLVHAFAQPPFHPLISEDLSQPERQDERLDEAFRLFMHKGLGTVTLFSAPMFLGIEYKGVLSISTRGPHTYTKEETRIYQTLSDQAIIAIENHRLLQATQQNLLHSQILSHLSQELLTADTAETIYNLTLEAIAVTNPDRGAGIFMYNQIEGDVELEMVGLWNNPRQEWPVIGPGARFSTEELGLSSLLKIGQTVTSNKATEDERFTEMLRQLLTIMQINTLVAVPVWLNREVSGFILIGNQTPDPFAPEIIHLYEDIARQMSSALENRRLFEEVQYRATLLQTVAEVSQVATSSLDLPILLPQTVELIRDRFGFYHVSIYLVDEYQKYAVVEASTSKIGQKLLNIKHRLEVGGKSVVGAATKIGKPRLAKNFGRDSIYFNNPLLPESQSEVALPLVARGRIIGALDVHSTTRGAFSTSDITILQSMADQLANAIEAARALQASRIALEETSKVHEYYLREQWTAFLKDQEAATSYRLTEQGLFVTEETWPYEEIDRVAETKQPIILSDNARPLPGDVQQPGDNGDKLLLSSYAEESQDTSVLIAPLTLQGQAVIGAVGFEASNQDHGWDEDELEIVAAVTSQAAQAIEAVRLFEQTQAAREEAEALYQVGRVLVATENEQEMLHTVLGAMLSILGLKQGGVLFIEEDRKFGKLHALFQEGQPVEPNMRIPIVGNPSYEKLIATKQPVVITDYANDPLVASVRELNVGHGIASLLLVPIIVNDQVIGALGADSVGKLHSFTEREINLARAMADQLSIILENRHLLEDTERRAVQLQATSEVSQVATSILDQEVMLSQAVELIRERFDFYHVQIFLIDEAKQYAVLYKSTGQAGQKLLEMNHKLAVGSQSVIGQVTYQRKSIVVRDTDLNITDTLYHRNEFLPDTRAELAIPLQVGDTLIGALDVQSTSPNAFSEEDISTLEILAAQLAIAIQNARAFTEQQRTAERLKEIDKLKTQFLANMSHELRTPLNSIIGFSRVILKGIDGPLTELQKTDLTSIHNSGQHLLSLINNILDLSKIEAGKMELNFEEVDLGPILKSVVSTAVALVKDKPVSLYQEIPDDLPIVWADSTRMRQIILNLVSNACKFTDEGAITVRAQADHEKVMISVADTGIGIPVDKLNSIFEEFTQVDASTTRKVGGTGLGLPISRHFVEMHQGQIWVESKPGRGSTFQFFIPIKPGEEQPELVTTVPEGKTDGRNKVIIAIDDDPSVITLYERFLERQDYMVIGINHKHDIVAQVKDLAPAAILLDVLMPEKDGWSILRSLKEDVLTKDIPVIICSIVSDKNRGFSLGAADYLVKPIAEQELLKALKYLESEPKKRGKVLVIDDQADDILLIRRILEVQSQYKIIEASNGKQGLELVHNVNPDLIILDLTMPEMDGFKVVEALKDSEKTRSIPIIIVTAKELSPAEQQLLTGQVEVLLRKGIFTENELLEDVSQALKRIHHAETV